MAILTSVRFHISVFVIMYSSSQRKRNTFVTSHIEFSIDLKQTLEGFQLFGQLLLLQSLQEVRNLDISFPTSLHLVLMLPLLVKAVIAILHPPYNYISATCMAIYLDSLSQRLHLCGRNVMVRGEYEHVLRKVRRIGKSW